ncbi:MAG: hypothetical protein EXS37_12650 [Opitutus sp.]|nr:hypothetical protein [Opitutus sp.]
MHSSAFDPSMPKIRWLNFSAPWLLLLLQRTPALRVACAVAEHAAPPRIVSLLQAVLAGAASLGAVHSLAGATNFVVSSPNVLGTVGTAITAVAFTVTGAAVPPASFRISGTLPPGLTVPNLGTNGVLNGTNGTIRGTPTLRGTFTVSILAYQLANGSGDSFGPTQIGFIISDAAATGPTITTQPASQSVNAGANVTLTVVAAGSPAPTYQWRKNGTLIDRATSATLALSNVQPADTGAYTVVVSNLAGIVTSSAANLTVTAVTAALAVTAQPQSRYVTPGASTTFTVGAAGTGVAYQWRKDGAPITGATSAVFTVANASAENMGFYAVTLSTASATVTSVPAALTVNTGGTSRLVNVSTRGFVPAGGALTPGFVLQGVPTKNVVIRAVGPTLGTFGVGGTLADPVMEVIPLGLSIAIASNDNWGGGASLQAAFSRVGAFPLAASSSTDASVATSLNATGASGYTVRITSKNAAAAGIALAEVYDEEDLSAPVRLVNVSTRGFVGTGEQALVPGFFIGGTAPKLLLIRAVGPGLAPFGVTGVLADPQLSLAPLGKDFAVAANDNWGGGSELQASFAQAGAFALPAGSSDAAVVIRLPPGGYTVVVSGVGNTSGTALVEVYDLDP